MSVVAQAMLVGAAILFTVSEIATNSFLGLTIPDSTANLLKIVAIVIAVVCVMILLGLKFAKR